MLKNKYQIKMIEEILHKTALDNHRKEKESIGNYNIRMIPKFAKAIANAIEVDPSRSKRFKIFGVPPRLIQAIEVENINTKIVRIRSIHE